MQEKSIHSFPYISPSFGNTNEEGEVIHLQEHSKKERQLAETPVPRLILRLSIPATLSMLVTSVYGIADALFVSRLGTAAAGAVGIVFSITSLLQAVGFTLGNGAGSLLSRACGANELERAGRLAALAFWLSLLLGGMLGIGGLFFLSPVVRFLGATEEIYPFAASYAELLLCAAPIICASFVLNNLLRAEGRSSYAALGFTVGNLLNIALDPILMFRLGMGCAGAALATVLSHAVALLILLSAYWFGVSRFSLRLSHAWRGARELWGIFTTGLPSLFRQGLSGVASILLTRRAALWGSAAVAGFSAVSRVFLVLYSFCLGIGQGLMPAAGYSKGAGNHPRTAALYAFSLKLATPVMLLLSAATYAIAPRVIGWFRPDAEVIRIGSVALRALCLVLPLHGIITVTNLFLQATGNRFGAALLAASRQGIFFLPLIFTLPRLWGLFGLQITQAVADLLTLFLTLPFVFRYFSRVRNSITPAVKHA